MIDIEQKVYKLLSEAIRATYTTMRIYSEYIRTPEVLPCIMIQEIDTQNYLRSQDTESVENHILVSYQIDIFTNGATKKEDAKAYATIINDKLLELKFSRTFANKLSNEDDDNIYRYVLRFSAIVGKDFYVYNIG